MGLLGLSAFPDHFSLTSMENVMRSNKDGKENSYELRGKITAVLRESDCPYTRLGNYSTADIADVGLAR